VILEVDFTNKKIFITEKINPNYLKFFFKIQIKSYWYSGG